jgi:rare lipoprotein A
MPRFGLGHGATATALLGLTATGVLVAQQLTNVDAYAATSQTYELNTVRATSPSALTTRAAVSTGQFEELYKPTPVPTVAPPTPAPTLVPTAAPTPIPTEAPKASIFERGIASTYGEGDGFEGRRTACGQIFHTHVVQVAHKSLPCGTMIRVEDPATGNSVDAEVTDRGPYIPGRIVDLSWGAFSQLDPTSPGLLSVNIYLLDE